MVCENTQQIHTCKTVNTDNLTSMLVIISYMGILTLTLFIEWNRRSLTQKKGFLNLSLLHFLLIDQFGTEWLENLKKKTEYSICGKCPNIFTARRCRPLAFSLRIPDKWCLLRPWWNLCRPKMIGSLNTRNSRCANSFPRRIWISFLQFLYDFTNFLLCKQITPKQNRRAGYFSPGRESK